MTTPPPVRRDTPPFAIDTLLTLDLTDPANMLVFRRGVAELAGWRGGVKPPYEGSDELRGYPPNQTGFQTDQQVPHFETSLDAALTLPLIEGAEFEIHVMSHGASYARVAIPISSRLGEAAPPFEDTANKPAEAVCRAWLRYLKMPSMLAYRAAQSARATADGEG